MEDLGAAEYQNRYIPRRSEKGHPFYRVALAVHNNRFLSLPV